MLPFGCCWNRLREEKHSLVLQALERVPIFSCISSSMIVVGSLLPSLLISIFGPQIRRGYPPNLSISFSGGKETKEDSPSNGERTGISPAPNLPSLRRQDLWCAGTPFSGTFSPPKSVGTRPFPVEGDRPVWGRGISGGCFPGVELLVSATQNGWYAPSKAKYAYETDSEQVP